MSEENDVAAEVGQNDATAENEDRRAVVISKTVVVTIESKSGKGVVKEARCNRDLFSVMDVVMSVIPSDKEKDVADDMLVTVRSLEDEEKSDKLKEGETRWSGPYGVANLEIDKMPMADAMSAFASAVLTPDVCLKGVERLAEQFFLRSRLDAFIQICVFDGIPAVVPLVNSMKDVKPESMAMLYQQMHIQAEVLRKWVGKQFPDMKVEWEKKVELPSRTRVKEEASGLVLPNGQPVETRMKKD